MRNQEEELKDLMFLIGTSSWGGTRKCPFVSPNNEKLKYWECQAQARH
jgi:hypothetical protein